MDNWIGIDDRFDPSMVIDIKEQLLKSRHIQCILVVI